MIIALSSFLLGCTDFFSSPGEGEIDILWRKKDSPIYINDCFVVPVGEMLFIEPGVEVRFKSSNNSVDFMIDSLNVGMLHVRGELIAEGTSTDSIVFTCENDRWGIIWFDSTSTGTNNLKHCKIEKARSVIRNIYGLPNLLGAISCYQTRVNISDCHISDNSMGIWSYQSEMRIEKNIIIDNNNYGISSYYSTNSIIANDIIDNRTGIWGENDMNSIISNNNFIDNQKAIHVRRDSNVNIINNTFINNELQGIELYNNTTGNIVGNIISDSDYGIICCQNTSPNITNNTIVKTSWGIKFKMDCNPLIRNCVLWNNVQAFCFMYSNKPMISYSLLQGDSLPSDMEDGGKNIFNRDPQFVNSFLDNFQLQESSPCVNAGDNNAPDLPATDTLGNPRISGPAVDIGAYEYQWER